MTSEAGENGPFYWLPETDLHVVAGIAVEMRRNPYLLRSSRARRMSARAAKSEGVPLAES